MVKTIKRYANRKLYDTETSSYVTLDQIAALVRQGVEFRIVDNRSKRDITSLTLAQILCEEEKRASSRLTLPALRDLIRSGEDFLNKRVRAPLFEMKDRTAETVDRLMGRVDEGPGGSSPATPGDTASPAEAPAPSSTAAAPTDLRAVLRELLDGVQRNFDEALHAVDEQVRRVLEGSRQLPDVEAELGRLREIVATLESRVMELEAALGSEQRARGDKE